MANVVCGIVGANTGKPQCDVPIGAIKYTLPTRGCEFTQAELVDSAALKTALTARMLLPKTDNQKIFLIPYANEVENNTGDAQVGTLSDGFEQVLNDALPKYIMKHARLGKNQNQAICAFNGWNDKIYFIDRNNRFCYLQKSDFGGKGFSVGNFYYDAPRPGGSNEVQTTSGRLTFASADEFKSSIIGLIDLDFNPADLVSLEDINMVQKLAPAANVFTIGGISRFGGVDIYNAYKTGLNNAARWKCINEQTGATISITSVATDDTNKGWTVTINGAAHTALVTGDKFSINIETPAVLLAAGVTGIEGNKIVYTK